ncbi:MAG: hypothetical protein KQA41_02930 [Candidatus Aenigmarchaeota archaeon]|nr:hypothetical protein [Candidatus Aenigmarchaeota archaeon]
MKFINFMLILLGIIGISLIIISLMILFFLKTPESINTSISYLSISTGILYLLFIFVIYKLSDKIR